MGLNRKDSYPPVPFISSKIQQMMLNSQEEWDCCRGRDAIYTAPLRCAEISTREISPPSPAMMADLDFFKIKPVGMKKQILSNR